MKLAQKETEFEEAFAMKDAELAECKDQLYILETAYYDQIDLKD